MLKQLKEGVEKVKTMKNKNKKMHENINRDRKSEKKPKTNSAAENFTTGMQM